MLNWNDVGATARRDVRIVVVGHFRIFSAGEVDRVGLGAPAEAVARLDAHLVDNSGGQIGELVTVAV